MAMSDIRKMPDVAMGKGFLQMTSDDMFPEIGIALSHPAIRWDVP